MRSDLLLLYTAQKSCAVDRLQPARDRARRRSLTDGPIALQLVCYAKQDITDSSAVLHLGAAVSARREQGTMESCWPMGNMGHQPPQKEPLRQRIQDALDCAFLPGSHGMSVARTTSETPPSFS